MLMWGMRNEYSLLVEEKTGKSLLDLIQKFLKSLETDLPCDPDTPLFLVTVILLGRHH